jgi:DNA repair protein RadC
MRQVPTAHAGTVDRILRFGSEQLTDAEVVAVLIAAGIRGREPLELAHELVERAGGLRALLAGGLGELEDARGVGRATAARLAAAVELGRRYLAGSVRRSRALGSPEDAAGFFRAKLCDLSYEVFGCLFLDTRHRVICFEPMFRGTLDGAAVYPREVLKRALHHNAAAIILGHNHPSGDSEPSEADRSITTRLSKALALIDIRLLDHLVVSVSGHVSLAERGWI